MRSKRAVFRLSLVLAAMMLALPFAASAQDATETPEQDPANPLYELHILADGETVQGFFAQDVTAQLYAFPAHAGDVVSVEMLQEIDSTLDPYIVVLGPRGQVLAKDDDSGDLELSARVKDLEIPQDGMYFVIASSFTTINAIITGGAPLDEDVSLRYAITVSGHTPTEDDELSYATSPLKLGDELIGYSNEDEPVFYFTHVAEADSAIDISLSSTDFDTLLMVFAPGGHRIAVNDDSDGAANPTDSGVSGLVLGEAGKYLIFATDIYFTSVPDEDTTLEFTGGDFTITLNAAAPAEE